MFRSGITHCCSVEYCSRGGHGLASTMMTRWTGSGVNNRSSLTSLSICRCVSANYLSALSSQWVSLAYPRSHQPIIHLQSLVTSFQFLVISHIQIQSLPRSLSSCNLPFSRRNKSFHLAVPSFSFCRMTITNISFILVMYKEVYRSRSVNCFASLAWCWRVWIVAF
jgi:hypothetical protein